VLVPTETSKRELLDSYRIDAGKISVIPYGVTQEFDGGGAIVEAPSHWGEWTGSLSSIFVLYVGRFHVRKNLERLIRAFSQLKARRHGVQLVLAGRDFWNRQRVEQEIRSLGLERDVLCPGHVEDAALEFLYRRAAVFAYPSLHEGFGFPPLEAMARGVPVLSSNVSAMTEVLGDAALLVDPLEAEAIAVGLERILGDRELRAGLISKGRERVRQFTWDRAARATLEVYHGVGEEVRGAPARSVSFT
jgi:glycosyltransferase involved in cell wall biosynthesis